MLGRRWKTLCVSLALVAACTHMPERSTIASSDYIRLERGPCFGACPIYDLTIYGDGNVQFVGKRYVRVADTMYSTIPKQVVDSLFDEAYRIRFFEMDSEYMVKKLPHGMTESVTDLPSQTVTISLDGTVKRVFDYYGSPEELRRFEEHIDRAANVVQWVGHR